jgi:hypothetical protein
MRKKITKEILAKMNSIIYHLKQVKDESNEMVDDSLYHFDITQSFNTIAYNIQEVITSCIFFKNHFENLYVNSDYYKNEKITQKV